MMLRDVKDFFTVQGLYKDWPSDLIDEDLYRHHLSHTLLVTEHAGRIMVAVCFKRVNAVSDDINEICWGEHNPRGGVVYVSEIAAREPWACKPLWAEFIERNPDYKSLRYVKHKRGKKRTLDFETFKKLTERYLNYGQA